MDMTDAFKPTGGMKAAARRALAWKKDGKAGGTRIGLTRANQIARGATLSRSTVMRMHSFFSRHAVDKQATGFSTGEEGFPSPGRVAWDLWGGDAGKAWAEAHRNRIVKTKKAVVILKAEGDAVPTPATGGKKVKERKVGDISQRIEPGKPENYLGAAPGQMIRSHVLRVASRLADRQSLLGKSDEKIAPADFHNRMISRGVHPDDLALHGLHKNQLERIENEQGHCDGFTASEYLRFGHINAPVWHRHDSDKLAWVKFHSGLPDVKYGEDVLGVGVHHSLKDNGTNLVSNLAGDHYAGLHIARMGTRHANPGADIEGDQPIRIGGYDNSPMGFSRAGYQVWHHRYNDFNTADGGQVRAVDEVQSDPAQKFAGTFFDRGHTEIHKLAPLHDLIQPHGSPDEQLDYPIDYEPNSTNEDPELSIRPAQGDKYIHAPILSAGPVNQRDFNWDSEYVLPYIISAAIADGKKGIFLPSREMQNGAIGQAEPHVARRADTLLDTAGKIQKAWGGDLRTDTVANVVGTGDLRPMNDTGRRMFHRNMLWAMEKLPVYKAFATFWHHVNRLSRDPRWKAVFDSVPDGQDYAFAQITDRDGNIVPVYGAGRAAEHPYLGTNSDALRDIQMVSDSNLRQEIERRLSYVARPQWNQHELNKYDEHGQSDGAYIPLPSPYRLGNGFEFQDHIYDPEQLREGSFLNQLHKDGGWTQERLRKAESGNGPTGIYESIQSERDLHGPGMIAASNVLGRIAQAIEQSDGLHRVTFRPSQAVLDAARASGLDASQLETIHIGRPENHEEIAMWMNDFLPQSALLNNRTLQGIKEELNKEMRDPIVRRGAMQSIQSMIPTMVKEAVIRNYADAPTLRGASAYLKPYDAHQRPYYEFPQEMIDAVKAHGWHPYMSVEQFNNMRSHLNRAVKAVVASKRRTVVILKAKERKVGDPSMAIPRGNPEAYSGLTVRGTSHQDNRGPFSHSFIRSTPLRIAERLAHVAELRGTEDVKIPPSKYHSLQVSRGAHPEDLALHGLHQDQFGADHEGMTAHEWMNHGLKIGPQWHDIKLPNRHVDMDEPWPNRHVDTRLSAHSFAGKSAYPGAYGERVLSVSLHPSADASLDLTSNISGDHYRGLLGMVPGADTHPALRHDGIGSERRIWHHRFTDRDIPDSDVKLRDIEEVQSDPIQKFGKQWSRWVAGTQDDMHKMLPMSRIIVPKTYSRRQDAPPDSPAYEAMRGINPVDFPTSDQKAVHAPILGAGPVGRGEFHWDSEYVMPYLIAAAVHDGRNAIMLPSARMQNGYVDSNSEQHVRRRNGETLPEALKKIQAVYGGKIEDTSLHELHSAGDAQEDQPQLDIPETLRRVTEMHPLLRGYRDYLTDLTLSLGRDSLLPPDVIKKIVDAGEQTDDATTVRLTNKNGEKLFDYDPNDWTQQFYRSPWYHNHRVDSDERSDYATYHTNDSWHGFGTTDPDPIVETLLMDNGGVTSMHPHTYIKLPYHWRDMARLESAPNQRLLEPRPEAEYQISPFLDAPHAHSALRGINDLMSEVGLHRDGFWQIYRPFSGDPADDMIMEFHPPKAVRDVLQSEGYSPEFLSRKLRFSLPEVARATANIASKIEEDPTLEPIKNDRHWNSIRDGLNDPEDMFSRSGSRGSGGLDRLFHKLTDHMVTGKPYGGETKKTFPVDHEIRPYYRIPDELQELVRTHGWSPYTTMHQFLNMRANLDRAVKAVKPEGTAPKQQGYKVSFSDPNVNEFATLHSGRKQTYADTFQLHAESPEMRFNSIRFAEGLARKNEGPMSAAEFHRKAIARGVSPQELAWGGLHPSEHANLPDMHPEGWVKYLSMRLPRFTMNNEDGFNPGLTANREVMRNIRQGKAKLMVHGVEDRMQVPTGTVSLRMGIHPLANRGDQFEMHDAVGGHGEPHIVSYKAFSYHHPDGRKFLVVNQIQSDWHQKKGTIKDDQQYRYGTSDSFRIKQFHKHDSPSFDATANREPGRYVDLPFGHTDNGEWENLALRMALHNAAKQGYDGVLLPGESWQNQSFRYDEVEPHVARRNAETLPREARKIVASMSDLGASMGKMPWLGTGETLHHIPITDAMRTHFTAHGFTPWGSDNPREHYRAVKALQVRIRIR